MRFEQGAELMSFERGGELMRFERGVRLIVSILFKRSSLPMRFERERHYGEQSSEEECLLEPEGSEEDAPEEDKPVWNKDYSIEEANGGEDEFYGGSDLEYENQDEAEYNEDIIR
ncbi:hypothetical protein F2Q68_00011081 [Brassica cretica]|uniref:Uncharacterized protein n=1 Tax=Brassica cretica TaxID=69181 RepID=A0A8S9KT59_BRACR|nr:hypothetical protein F2Q68_00011081 [Brassica cretica]